ncbi:cytochrome c oxidase subunit II [Halopiger aswanensis]|uniref:Cytochrome c oxidase subunit 2 n=1 Tax=Halopiger aswanensis TaxID=148449 RepID=A0A419WH38_9EURY|nr:cytochrome c oxidase subunit II [Halopiger aswanensis]RKD94733.1 cytochrome c oxidase subunit 2 [Halopiger aswanensis]
MQLIPEQGSRVDVFEGIFLVFLGLGTLVGIVVVSYILYNAYKYRDTGEVGDDENLPSVGELPTGGKGGKKLFLSFGLSAIIVISLVVWTYGMLLYVEDGPEQPEDAIEIEVEGYAFGWDFYYDNGIETSGYGEGLVVPADQAIWIETTSRDVWHTFGIPDLRVKADAIPGEYDQTWFQADEPGEHTAKCFELCGPQHSDMLSDVTVLEQSAYEEWMNEQLTANITLEDGNESPVTEGFEVTLEHQNNSDYDQDLSYTFTPDSEEFDNGTITVTLERGGPYDLTISPTDGQFEEVEETIDVTGPTDETYTLEDPNASEDDSSDGGDDGGNESADDGGSGSDTDNATDDETGNNETSDGGDGE